MLRPPDPSTGYERLLREQLRSTETLDVTFAAGPDLTVAVTSDRLLIIGPTPPNGWGLKSIPWRLVTGLEPDAADARSIRLRYEVASRKPTGSWGGAAEPSVGQDPDAPTPGEVLLVLPEDGGRTVALLNVRIAEAQQA